MTDELRSIVAHAGFKLSSARWFLAVLCGWTFAYLSCSGKLEPKDAMQVVIMVVTFYFSRKEDAT